MYGPKLTDYAVMTSKSMASFKRDFQKHYGTSPGKWLTVKRLNRAKRFLETGQKNISDITFKSGFNNVSHFSKVFKEYFGKSPVGHRNTFQKA